MLKIIAILLVVCVLGQSQVTPQVCKGVDEECGGVRQAKCCLGQQLRCKYHTPIHPEATGVCQKTCNVEGGICAGFSRDPQICCGGLKCVFRDDHDQIPDLPGTCKNTTGV